MREKFLDLQTQNSSKQHGGVALAARVEKKAGNKYVKSKREYSDFSSSQKGCLLYTSPSPRDKRQSRMPSSA